MGPELHVDYTCRLLYGFPFRLREVIHLPNIFSAKHIFPKRTVCVALMSKRTKKLLVPKLFDFADHTRFTHIAESSQLVSSVARSLLLHYVTFLMGWLATKYKLQIQEHPWLKANLPNENIGKFTLLLYGSEPTEWFAGLWWPSGIESVNSKKRFFSTWRGLSRKNGPHWGLAKSTRPRSPLGQKKR